MHRFRVAQLMAVVLLLCAAARPAHAQLNTQHIKGTVGLKAGSQASPHWYLIALLVTPTTPTSSGIVTAASSRSMPTSRLRCSAWG